MFFFWAVCNVILAQCKGKVVVGVASLKFACLDLVSTHYPFSARFAIKGISLDIAIYSSNNRRCVLRGVRTCGTALKERQNKRVCETHWVNREIKFGLKRDILAQNDPKRNFTTSFHLSTCRPRGSSRVISVISGIRPESPFMPPRARLVSVQFDLTPIVE